MARPPSSAERLLRRVRDEGPLLPLPDGSLGVFEPSVALALDAANTDGLAFAASAFDLKGVPEGGMPWRDVRRLLVEQNRRLNGPAELERLHAGMRAFLAEDAGRSVDLSWLAARAVAQPLIPLILGGASPASTRALVADQEAKLRRQLDAVHGTGSRLRAAAYRWSELRAGRAIAREMRRRADGKAPPREDFAEAVLAMRRRIGPIRANYLVMTLLTAVSTAPGAVAACLLFELLSRPEWRRRIGGEFDALPPGRLYRDPAPLIPATMRFIKEVMRLWPFPLVTRRVAHRDLEAEGVRVAAGGLYDMSAFVMHRLPEYWDDADRFDPDRWLAAARPAAKGTYVPFGFGPRTCVGAALGQSQLILFCELAARAFDFDVAEGRAPRIGSEVLAIPHDFAGVVKPAAPREP